MATPDNVQVKARWNVYGIALGVILLIMTILHALHANPGTGVHLTAGERLVAGGDIYQEGYVYPPLSAMLTAPLAVLPLRGAQIVWWVISAVALAMLVKLAWTLSGGRRVDRFDGASRGEHWMLWLGVVCALRFAFNAFDHLSLDLLISMFIMMGGLAAVRKRFAWTAIWWGVSAAFKGPPLLFAGYLVWRGKWWQAGLMVFVAVFVNVLPDLVHRPAGGGIWLTQWYQQIIAPLGRPGYTPGEWHADILDNQSIAGAVNRWWLTTYTPDSKGIVVDYRRDVDERKKMIKPIVYGTDLFICVLVGLAMWPGAFPRAVKRDGELSSRGALEISVVILLMLLFSPMSSRSLFCTMLLPAFCLARAGIVGRDRMALACLIAAIVGSVISFRAPFARALNDEMHWLGIVTMCALALLAGCLWLLVRHRRAMGAPTGEGVAEAVA